MPIHPLHSKIQAYIRTLASPDQPVFDEAKSLNLFIETLQYQWTNNDSFRNYLKAEYGDNVKAFKKIKETNLLPSLPTDAFKHRENPTTLSTEDITKTFLTSGTTTDTRGSHHFASTSTYEASILAAWTHCELPLLHQTFFLTPSVKESPQSSLSHMMETLKATLAQNASYILKKGVIAHQPILDCVKENRPVTILGTALSFLQFFKKIEQEGNIQLPAGSWALETGGYKGSNESLTKEELYHKFQTHLGLESDQVWNEYSMTELSSQFYTRGLNNAHVGPPWAPIKVINPETNLPVGSGELGYLVIYDLANIDSAIGIRTQDLAIYHTPNSFTLIGRDPAALPRGCSRSV